MQNQQPTKSLAERTADVLTALGQIDHMKGFPREDKNLRFIARVLAKFIDTEEQEHEALGGRVIPLEWIVEEVAAHCEYFPPPIKWREMYQQYFQPLDGRSAYDMRALAED